MQRLLFPFFFSISFLASAQSGVFIIDTLTQMTPGNYSEPGQLLKGWLFHPGDDPSFSGKNFNDSSWKTMPPEGFDQQMKDEKGYTAWYRLRFRIRDSFDTPLALLIRHSGASQLFLDGKLIHSNGTIAPYDPGKEERFYPQGIPLYLPVHDTAVHVLAVRYSNSKIKSDGFVQMAPGFTARISLLEAGMMYKIIITGVFSSFFTFYFTFFLVLSLLHFLLFWFYRKKTSNLYFAVFSLAFGFTFVWLALAMNVTQAPAIEFMNTVAGFLPPLYMTSLLAMLHFIFYGKIKKWLLAVFGLFLLQVIFGNILNIEIPLLGLILTAFFAVESIRVILASILSRKEGAWIIGVGILATILFFMGVVLIGAFGGTVSFTYGGTLGALVGIMVIYATISIPLSMTIYLSRDVARTSRSLEKKLVEVETLSARSMEQEKEKQRILESQKEMLELQVRERTTEISEQKKVIEEKNKDITDSINYAKRIQDSILPGTDLIRSVFPASFVLFKPKDIVSGDFYWFGEKDGWSIAVCADCTGHGVPGALMSMIGTNLLHQAILEKGITSPEKILAELQYSLLVTLKQLDGTICAPTRVQDGMDIAILCFNRSSHLIRFAGAQRPLWRIRNGELEEWKGDKIPISASGDPKTLFKGHEIPAGSGDLFIMSSDGYADQFGGSSSKAGGKKLMTKEFKKRLVELSLQDIMGIEVALDQEFEKWRGELEQMDDVCVIGVRV